MMIGEEVIAYYGDAGDGAELFETSKLVRCKDCIHNPWKEDDDYTCIWDDDFADRPQTPNDFCSYGERGEE